MKPLLATISLLLLALTCAVVWVGLRLDRPQIVVNADTVMIVEPGAVASQTNWPVKQDALKMKISKEIEK